jgi:laminin, beta 1
MLFFYGESPYFSDCQVCDGNGDPCDSLCGGAGCGKCGGSASCHDGAVTLADNAISMANRSEHALRIKREETDVLLTRVSRFCR